VIQSWKHLPPMPHSSSTKLSSEASWEDDFNEHVFIHLENGEGEIM